MPRRLLVHAIMVLLITASVLGISALSATHPEPAESAPLAQATATPTSTSTPSVPWMAVATVTGQDYTVTWGSIANAGAGDWIAASNADGSLIPLTGAPQPWFWTSDCTNVATGASGSARASGSCDWNLASVTATPGAYPVRFWQGTGNTLSTTFCIGTCPTATVTVTPSPTPTRTATPTVTLTPLPCRISVSVNGGAAQFVANPLTPSPCP